MPVPHATSPRSGPRDLTTLLPLASAGAGLLGYLLAFLDAQAAGYFAGIPGFAIITAAAVVGLRLLPRSPNTIYAAVPLAAVGALVLFQVVLRGGADAMVIIIMVLALCQLGAVVGTLLLETGVVGNAPVSQARQGPVPPKPGNPGQFRPPQGGWSPPPRQGGPAKPGHFFPPGGGLPPPPPPPNGPRPQGPPLPPYGRPPGGPPAPPAGPPTPSAHPPESPSGVPRGTPNLPPSGGQPESSPEESPYIEHGDSEHRDSEQGEPSGGRPESSSPDGPKGTQHLPFPAAFDEP